MRRVLMVLIAAASVILLAGCVGGTDRASDVRTGQAQLNATGHTNNGPASWWWEYSPVRSVVAAGNGTQTKHYGPASSSNDVYLSTVVTGLDRSQAYYFRACGQDQAAGSSKECGAIAAFYTAPADSTLASGDPGTFSGAQTVAHDVNVSTPTANYVEVQETEDASTSPETGSDVLFSSSDSANCSHGPDSTSLGTQLTPYPDNATCLAEDLSMTLGPYDDFVQAYYYNGGTLTVNLGAGDDYFDGPGTAPAGTGTIVTGGDGNDTLIGGPESSHLSGGNGNDLIYGDGQGSAGAADVLDGGSGDDELFTDGVQNTTLDCGAGNDTIYVTSGESYTTDGQCENVVVESSSAQHQAAQAVMSKARSRMQSMAKDGHAAMAAQVARTG